VQELNGVGSGTLFAVHSTLGIFLYISLLLKLIDHRWGVVFGSSVKTTIAHASLMSHVNGTHIRLHVVFPVYQTIFLRAMGQDVLGLGLAVTGCALEGDCRDEMGAVYKRDLQQVIVLNYRVIAFQEQKSQAARSKAVLVEIVEFG